MKAAYKKIKGAKLERKVASLIRQKGLDDGARRMIGSGAFDNYKSDIFTNLPLTIECKNQERVNLWEFWDQAKSVAKPLKPACLVVSGNFRPVLAIVDIDTLLNLLLEIKQLNEKFENI